MRDNGKIMKETEEEFNNGKMAPSTKVIGRKMSHLDMVDLSMLTEMSILGSGLMIEPQEKVFFCILRSLFFILWCKI
jgi:hypothetical protein